MFLRFLLGQDRKCVDSLVPSRLLLTGLAYAGSTRSIPTLQVALKQVPEIPGKERDEVWP
jgi:hypothetical protein